VLEFSDDLKELTQAGSNQDPCFTRWNVRGFDQFNVKAVNPTAEFIHKDLSFIKHF
jgi:hypothetical protein